MVAGLYTFGGNVNGLLLSNYAGTDLDACMNILRGYESTFCLNRLMVLIPPFSSTVNYD